MKRSFAFFAVIVIMMSLYFPKCHSENKPTVVVYCVADKLNGRIEPNKKSKVETKYEYGDDIELTGETNGEWVEAYGGESGTVWIYWDYVSETLESFKAINITGGRVRIHSRPSSSSKTVAYVKSGKSITIKRTLYGFGYTGRGWVDLSCFYFDE